MLSSASSGWYLRYIAGLKLQPAFLRSRKQRGNFNSDKRAWQSPQIQHRAADGKEDGARVFLHLDSMAISLLVAQAKHESNNSAADGA